MVEDLSPFDIGLAHVLSTGAGGQRLRLDVRLSNADAFSRPRPEQSATDAMGSVALGRERGRGDGSGFVRDDGQVAVEPGSRLAHPQRTERDDLVLPPARLDAGETAQVVLADPDRIKRGLAWSSSLGLLAKRDRPQDDPSLRRRIALGNDVGGLPLRQIQACRLKRRPKTPLR